MKGVSPDVPDGDRCPLCGDVDVDHYEWGYEWDVLLKAPVCYSCSYYVLNLIVGDERMDDPVMDQIEEMTGLSFHECQVLYLPQQILSWEESLMRKRKAQKTCGGGPEEEEILEIERRLWEYRGYLRRAKKHLKG